MPRNKLNDVSDGSGSAMAALPYIGYSGDCTPMPGAFNAPRKVCPRNRSQAGATLPCLAGSLPYSLAAARVGFAASDYKESPRERIAIGTGGRDRRGPGGWGRRRGQEGEQGQDRRHLGG